MKFYPNEKGGGGAGKVLAMLKGGGDAKSFHFLKGGHEKFYPVLRRGGGGTKSFGPAVFPLFSPPPPRN